MVVTAQNLGIKETRELLALGLTLLMAGSSFAQKKPAEGSTALMESVALAFPALEGIGQVDDELKNLDAAEIDILTADVKAKLPGIVPEKALRIAQICVVVGAGIAKGIAELSEPTA
jgi:hypothetical protein